MVGSQSSDTMPAAKADETINDQQHGIENIRKNSILFYLSLNAAYISRSKKIWIP